ncbi:MAG: polysaccharide ABC transporter ATP-binding protein [Arenicellales bacterium]
MKSAISVSSLSKQYQIGSESIHGQTFREMLVGVMSSPFSRFHNLRRNDPHAERIWALKDVSFEVEQGEILGVVGKNGAGKSTLLKLLSRITAPTSGEIVYRGRLAALLEVGTGFHPELTGRENIFLNGTILGMGRNEIRAKLERIVEFAEVAEFLDTPVKRYSSGMLVRLAFSVSAHLEPNILIIDEVLAVGDISFQKKCIEQMQGLTKLGCTVLVVSHNMGIVQTVADRCLLLENGSVDAIGTTQDVVECYLKKYSGRHGLTIEDCSSATVMEFSGFVEKIENRQIRIIIRVKLEFVESVDEIKIDFAIENTSGLRLVQHVASDAEQKNVSRGETLRAEYNMDCTQLLPGEYFGVLYVYSKILGVVLHLEEVALFSVPRSKELMEICSNHFTPAIIPEIGFSVSVS